MYHRYNFRDTLAASERIGWRVEDLIGGDNQLDFSRPFMPETLARVEGLDFLSPEEKLVLNHIRGHEYLCMFGLVEEFILPFVVDHARPRLNGDDYRVRALLQFATEEAKHIHLFKTFREAFDGGFGTPIEMIGPAEAISSYVLTHHPLAVALVILQVEWMTQSHYLDSVRENRDLDPVFRSLLRHHWMEEAQHAKLDTLMVEALADGIGEAEMDQVIDDYIAIGGFIDNGLEQQTAFNVAALQGATGRTLTTDQREALATSQRQAARWTYLGSGMMHQNFLATLDVIWPSARTRVEELAPTFC